MDPAAILERFLDAPRVVLVRAVLDRYGRAPGGLLANGLAFSTLFATVPLALVTLGLTGWLGQDPRIQDDVASVLGNVFPPLRALIEQSLASLVAGAGITSVIGLVGTIWTVSQLYVALDVSFGRIFGDDPARDPWRRTARGFVWVALLLTAVAALIVTASFSAMLAATVPDSIPVARLVADVLGSPLLLAAASVVVVAAIYRVLPPLPPRWRSIWWPAAVAGIVIMLLSQLFVFVAPRIVSIAAVVGSLATVFVALTWLSLSFQVLLYGAAWVSVRDADETAPSALAVPAAPAEPRGGGQR